METLWRALYVRVWSRALKKWRATNNKFRYSRKMVGGQLIAGWNESDEMFSLLCPERMSVRVTEWYIKREHNFALHAEIMDFFFVDLVTAADGRMQRKTTDKSVFGCWRRRRNNKNRIFDSEEAHLYSDSMPRVLCYPASPAYSWIYWRESDRERASIYKKNPFKILLMQMWHRNYHAN